MVDTMFKDTCLCIRQARGTSRKDAHRDADAVVVPHAARSLGIIITCGVAVAIILCTSDISTSDIIAAITVP